MLTEKLDAYLEKQRKVYPCHTNRASDLGHECDRYLVFSRTRWQEASLPELDLQYIFNEGNHQERAVYRDLEAAGVTIYEQQVSLHWKEPNISCHLDGKTVLDLQALDTLPEAIRRHYGDRVPATITAVVEVKSMAPWIWQQINTADDMLHNKKYPHLRKYPAQVQVGMILANLEWALFLPKNKQTGKLKEILVPLDLAYTEELVQKAERINRFVQLGETPPPIPWNERLCGKCKFNHICANDQIRTAIEIIEDSELEAMLDKRGELEAAAEEFDDLDKELKEYFRGKEKSLVGHWMVLSKKQDRKDHKEVWNTAFHRIKGGDDARGDSQQATGV